ncbi:MAG: hypothetical protein D0530_04910 [Methylococcales bacterium]|nr:MAG: hypothetical protein D0530_04910 [Methylococcales bacterium]
MATYGSKIQGEIDQWLSEALDKRASEGDTNTSHPSKKVEDATEKATEGARSAENTADVKSQIHNSIDAASADATSGAGRGEKNPSLHLGNESKSTGEDPAHETSSVKGTKDDAGRNGGTSHPAKGSFGEKYSSLYASGNDILTAIAAATKTASKTCKCGKVPCACEKKIEAAVKHVEKIEEPKDEEPKEILEAKAAGYQAAYAAAVQIGLVKDAGVEQARQADAEVIANIVKSAEKDAANVFDYIAGFIKASEGEQEAMMAAGQGAPAGPEGVALPPAAGPEAAGGAPAGGAGGQPSEQEIMALVESLIQAGVKPEDILALAQHEGAVGGAPTEGAAPGGMSPGAGQGPGMEAQASAGAVKAAEAMRSALKTLASNSK